MGRKTEKEPEYNCTALGPRQGPPLRMLMTLPPAEVLKLHKWLDEPINGSTYSLIAYQQGWSMTFTHTPCGGLHIVTKEEPPPAAQGWPR